MSSSREAARAQKKHYKRQHPGRSAEQDRTYRLRQKALWPKDPEPNRTEAARELLRPFPSLSNAEVAQRVGVNEKCVRRARMSL